MRFSVLSAACAVFASLALPAATITDAVYRPVQFQNQTDYHNDAQGRFDIIGNEQNPGFYTAFDGTFVYYRVRLGTYESKGYNGVFWVGIDVNNNGGPDLFVGVNNQGSARNIQFQNAGSGANLSPSTTTIQAPQVMYQYNYTVGTDYQYSELNMDLDADSTRDAFLTFRIRLYGTSEQMSLERAVYDLTNVRITPTSVFSYVIATSTQANSINQDIGGLPATYNANSTWRQLGAISYPMYANGDVAAPEAETWLLTLSGLGMVSLGYRRRR